MTHTYDAVVVGAGPNGLIAAAYEVARDTASGTPFASTIPDPAALQGAS